MVVTILGNVWKERANDPEMMTKLKNVWESVIAPPQLMDYAKKMLTEKYGATWN